MRISLGQRAHDAHPVTTECSWPQFVQWLYAHQRTAGDKDGPYVCLAEFTPHASGHVHPKNGPACASTDPYRSLSALVASCGVPLDFDKGTVGPADIARVLAGYAFVAYTTYKHTEAAPRWRVFVPVAAPMDAATHKATWATLNAAFSDQADHAASDASRLSYLPGACVDPAAARCIHSDGAFLQPTQAAPPTPVVTERGDGPVPGWVGPSDDATLLAIACNTRIKPSERFGGPVHFAMLWTGNSDWLAQNFPPSGDDTGKGRAWNYTQADAALGNELMYFTGGDVERAAALLRRSGIGRDHDDDWSNRKVYAALELAMKGRGPDQFHFMGSAKDIAAAIKNSAQPTDSELADAVAGMTAGLSIGGVPVPTGTRVDIANIPGGGIEIDADAPPTYCLDKKMQFPATLENVVYVLGKQRHWMLGYDEFRGRVMVAPVGTEDWRPVSDNDQVAMRETFGRELHFAAVGKDLMRDAVNLIAERHKFDSAQVWLEGLAWDGVPRVGTYLSSYCGVEDTPYTRAVSRYIWTGLAGRIMSPGCQLDMVVAFQSPQGRRKSTGLAAMVPDPECFTDGLSLHEGGDDFKRMLKGKLVIEIAELAGLSKADVNAVKMTITRRFEEWVEKWETQPRRYQRRGMLFASTNEQYFLPADDTGNRRWLPVPGVTLDRDAIERDRLQLWAEGRTVYAQTGIAWQDAEQLAPAEHGAHVAVDVWGESIETWLNTVPPITVENSTPVPPPSCRPFSMPELLRGALHMNNERQDMRAEKRVAGVLRVKGYEQKSVRTPSGPRKLWVKQTQS